MIKKFLLAAVASVLVIFGIMAVPAFAVDDPCEGWTGPSKDLICDTGSEEDLMDTVGNVLNTVYSLIAIVAVVMIVVGGVKYTISQGNANTIASAKNTILYAIIGLIIVLLAFAITNFALGALKGA